MKETMELVKIDPKEFGLNDETARNIQQQFQPMLDKMVELEDEFNEVMNLPVDAPETARRAKEVRLKYVKVRTGTAEIHRAQKAFYLNGGRFVDGWKNAQLFASQGKEQKLEEKEKYFENLEKQRIEALQQERVEQISRYVDDAEHLQLGEMQQDVFDAYLTAKRNAYNDRIAAEKKAEEDRIKKEQAEAAEQERIRKENIRLQKEAKAREKALEAERAKAEAERKAAEEKARLEREAVEKKAAEERKIREKRTTELRPYIIFIRDYESLINAYEEKYQKDLAEIKIGAEQHWEHERKEAAKAAAEKAKLEVEIRAKREAEEKAQREAEAKEKAIIEAERKAKAAPDKEKLLAFAEMIDDMQLPELATDQALGISENVNQLLIKVSTYIRQKANEL